MGKRPKHVWLRFDVHLSILHTSQELKLPRCSKHTRTGFPHILYAYTHWLNREASQRLPQKKWQDDSASANSMNLSCWHSSHYYVLRPSSSSPVPCVHNNLNAGPLPSIHSFSLVHWSISRKMSFMSMKQEYPYYEHNLLKTGGEETIGLDPKNPFS